MEKKHIKQMTKEEIAFIREKITNSLKGKPELLKHAQKRVIEKIGTLFDIEVLMTTIKTGNIIEYKICDNGNSRVVLRDKRNAYNHNICLVYEFETNSIITVWVNEINDQHRTLDLRKYTLKNIKG